MHIPTHILSGWVIGNAVPLRPRERLMCMLAASLADIDGLGIIFGDDLYQRWHHVACHGIVFGFILSIILTSFSTGKSLRRVGLFSLYLVLFHLHLLMDYYGSGPGWPIVYLYPLSDWRIVNWNAWELSSWQNIVTAYALLAVTVGVAIRCKRTPLEVLMPSLDAKLVRRPATLIGPAETLS
jgi:hypothetical protein